MSQLSLASRYRPQKFAEVCGQELVTSALSRVCALDNPAPAYLLSGTRGVGKTTIARIFAKALNCEKGPAGEPCNECPQCLKITGGRHVDVCEIDGASNNRVEDARSLRENIGYAPMEGRYKVFIIDEAHMLTTNAFNALLKTLEEPPRRVVFIFATTEAHKFPITIVSRCQHFVFGHLSEAVLGAHLDKILKMENIPAEAGALQIIARRAAGSVRDSLSLLDQVLAFDNTRLTVDKTREVLGLAGQELFDRLLLAIAQADLQTVINICRQVLRRGLDIGYFLRELAQNLRNLFLLNQEGEKIAPALGLSENERAFLMNRAGDFSPAHLHAAWQMALTSQREVVQSPEPGTVLEMLLLNMALLPKLLPVSQAGGIPGMQSPKANPTPHRPADTHASEEAEKSGEALEQPKSPVARPVENSESCPVSEISPSRSVDFDWEAFREFCKSRQESGKPNPGNAVLAALRGYSRDGVIILQAVNNAVMSLVKSEFDLLKTALGDFCGDCPVELVAPAAEGRMEQDVKEELQNNPELKPCMDILKAKITRCREKTQGVYNA